MFVIGVNEGLGYKVLFRFTGRRKRWVRLPGQRPDHSIRYDLDYLRFEVGCLGFLWLAAGSFVLIATALG